MDTSENKAPKNLNQSVTVLGKKKIFLNQRPRDFLEVLCKLILPPFPKKKKKTLFLLLIYLSCLTVTEQTEVQLTLLYI